MGNACTGATQGRVSGQKIQGKGRDLVVPSGNKYALIVAFNYEAEGSYKPWGWDSNLPDSEEAQECYPNPKLSSIPDGEHFASLCEASDCQVECYYDKMVTRSKGFPDKAMIVDKIKEYAQMCGPEDVFLFFFAGHGDQKEGQGDELEESGKDEVLAFVDQTGEPQLLVDNEVADVLLNFNPETHVVIVTDCCHSGTVCDLSRPELADYQICHLAAVKDTQGATDLGDGGAFTSSLCETMEKFAQDGEEDLSVTQVYNACFEEFSNMFDEQDFSFESTANVDPDAFRWPLMPPSGWTVKTALDAPCEDGQCEECEE